MKFYKANSLKASLLIIGGLGFSLTGFLSNYAHAAQIVVGNKSAFYITDIVGGAGGDMFAWGANGSGQLGDGTQADALSPIATAFESDAGQALGPWVRLATNMSGITGDAFEGHTLAIDSDGRLWAWGDNSLGQLGQGNTTSKLKPVRVGNASNWIDVEVGSAFSIALNDEGEIWLWGDNRFGQLGPDVVAEFQSVPTQLPDKDGTVANNDIWIKIAAGAEHVLAIHGAALTSTNGRLYAWGRNTVDQLGLGAGQSSQTNTPTPVNATLWREVEAGSTSSFAITATGSRLHAWGQGAFGNLGLGPTSGTSIQNASTPQEVDTNLGQRTFVGVSAGSSHTLAWSSTGQLFVAGQNASGQLGISATSPQIYNSFQYLGGVVVDSASAGRASSIILLDDGSVLTAGANDRGQLGNGTTASTRSFTQTSLGAVDLSIESLSFSSNIEGLSEGDTFDIQLLIRNNGTGTVSNAELAAIVYDFALSPALVPGAEGELSPVVTAPSYSAAEIGPASAIAADFTLTVPAITQGDYFVLVELDSTDTLEESDETNNTAVSDAEVPILFRSDLTISYVSAAPLVVDTGDTITVDYTISNGGTGDIPAGVGNGFAYRIFLSEFEDESVGDVYELQPANVGDELLYELGLDAAATTAVLSIDLTVPEEVDLSKTYYVGLVVDSVDQINESEEANNTAFSAAGIVTVNGLSIPDALDIAGDPDEPAFTVAGDASWFGQPNVTDATGLEAGAARSPSLDAGEFASVTFSYPEPREVTFRWKAETSSSANRLFFGANLVPLEPSGQGFSPYLFGTQDWDTVSYIIPADTEVGFFYEQGVVGADDSVFVDQLQISDPITIPDYIIESIDYTVGDYVLQRDTLSVTVTGTNRGATATLPNDFALTVWLSADLNAGDLDDVELGNRTSFTTIDNGQGFVYQAEFDLPEELQDTNYYVLARIDSDDLTVEFDEPDPADFGLPADYEAALELYKFSDDDNNFRFSDEAGVGIDRRADLRVINLIQVDGNEKEAPIFVGGPYPEFDSNISEGDATTVYGQFIVDPLVGERSDIIIGFDVVNDGLAPVQGLGQAYEVEVYFSTSREVDPVSGGMLLQSFTEGGGLAEDAGKSFRVTSNIPDSVPAGSFYYVAVVVDSGEAVPEVSEGNNSTYSVNRDVFVGELPLEVALNDNDLDDPTFDDPDTPWDTRQWDDGFRPSSVTQSNPSSPWFGQTAVFGVDSAVRAAAQSGPVGTGGSSYLETEVVVGNTPLQVSFYWRVSSQFEVINGAVFEDPLIFSIKEDNDAAFSEIRKISGTDNTNFRLFRYSIEEPGTYTLRWEYIESGDGTQEGSRAGWVDGFEINEFPNLRVTAITAGNTDVYTAGDILEGWSITVQNTGGLNINKSFDVAVRLIAGPESEWSDSDSIPLGVINDTVGLLAGASRTYTSSDATLTLPVVSTIDPEFEYNQEFYLLGAFVDLDETGLTNGQVDESDETVEDNSEVTGESLGQPRFRKNYVQIGLPDLTGSSGDVDGLAGPYLRGESVNLEVTLTNSGDGELPAGSDVFVSMFISSSSDVTDPETDAATVSVGEGSLTTGAAILSGATIGPIDIIVTMPTNIDVGDYYLVSVIDIDNTITEEPALLEGEYPSITPTRESGEGNNLFVSPTSVVELEGLSLFNGLNDEIAANNEDGSAPALTESYAALDLGSVVGSASNWFGLADAGAIGGDIARSPDINEGEFTAFSLQVEGSSLVSFNWGILNDETGDDDSNTLEVYVNDKLYIFNSPDASSPGDFVPEPLVLRGANPVSVAATEVLVPEGGIVEWRFTQGSDNGQYGLIDNIEVADNTQADLEITALDYSANVPYVLDISGIVGQDNTEGTEYLDISIDATNLGATIDATNFTTADIEVRLSTNTTAGDDDDIVLGTFSQVEGDLVSGSLIRFLGPIQLGDSIPEGTYYLYVRIDSNDEVDEFRETNNFLWSENRDVEIERRPALRIYNPKPRQFDPSRGLLDDEDYLLESLDTEDGIVYLDPREGAVLYSATEYDDILPDSYADGEILPAFDVDEEIFHYTEAPMRLRFNIQNIGLDAVRGDENFTVQLSLIGALRNELSTAVAEGDLDAFVEAFSVNLPLREFTVSELIPGRSTEMPEGGIKSFDVEFALPSEARFNAVLEPDTSVNGYLWIFGIDIDPNGLVPQSEIIRESPALVLPSEYSWRIMNIPEAFGSNLVATNTNQDDGLFAVSSQPDGVTASFWEGLFDDPTSEVVENPYPVSDEANLLAYAFNRNPTDGDTSVSNLFPDGTSPDTQAFPGSYGFIALPDPNDVEDPIKHYFSLTFDIVTRAEDLIYIVEASADAGFGSAATLLTVEPPFNSSVGRASLTDLGGGLISEYGAPVALSNPLSDPIDEEDLDNVVTVVDQGYSARITIRDNVSRSADDARFMRVRVLLSDSSSRMDEFFVIPEMVLLGVAEDDPDVGSLADFDSDLVNNFLELMFNFDPTDGGDTPVLTDEDVFVAEQLAANLNADDTFVGAALFVDYDGDGVDDLIEIIAGSNPNDPASVPTAEEEFVASALAADGVLEIVNTSPNEDLDGDNYSNLVELLYGFDPDDDTSTPVLSKLEIFVAEQMATLGALQLGFAGLPTLAIEPVDNFDVSFDDLNTNTVELLIGDDPTDSDSFTALNDDEIFVINQLAGSGVLQTGISNYLPDEDFDGDGVSNIAEILYGFSPNNDQSVPVISPLEISVAEAIVQFPGFVFAGFGPYVDIGPFENYDGSGDNNIDEINAGTDPTIP